MTSPFDPFQTGGSAVNSPRSGGSESAHVFGGPAADQTTLQISGPPTGILVAAAVLAAAGTVLAVLGWGGWLALLGWALAAPLAIGALGLFTAHDTDRRARPVYLRPGWLGPAYWAVTALSVTGTIVGALGVAFWLGRL